MRIVFIGSVIFSEKKNTIRSLAALRGNQSGFEAAEAFELVYEQK